MPSWRRVQKACSRSKWKPPRSTPLHARRASACFASHTSPTRWDKPGRTSKKARPMERLMRSQYWARSREPGGGGLVCRASVARMSVSEMRGPEAWPRAPRISLRSSGLHSLRYGGRVAPLRLHRAADMMPVQTYGALAWPARKQRSTELRSIRMSATADRRSVICALPSKASSTISARVKSAEEILRQHPMLEPQDISACLAFASRLMRHRYSVQETA